jgi:hypothetical protein
MVRQPLDTDEISDSIEADDYIIVDLDDDHYWAQAEGRVRHVVDRDDTTIIHISSDSKLYVNEADGDMRFDGAPAGATDLRVDGVYKK